MEKRIKQNDDRPLIMVNPQWQGGGDLVTYHGAQELKKLYLADAACLEMPTDLNTELLLENGIIGYDVIHKQMRRAYSALTERRCAKIFSLGGGCDADVPTVAYLNKACGGELTVLWLDAHGDLNSPQESKSGLFYGMPARPLLGGSGLFGDIITRPLTTRQFMHIGGRDFDEAEVRYLQTNNIWHAAKIFLNDIRAALDERQADRVYIHLDLDVLRPEEFPNTPVPVAGGVSQKDVLALLAEIKANYTLAGLGLYEYAPCGEKSAFLQSVFDIVLR